MLSCASCGTENRSGARFCDGCGAPLAPPVAERRKLATLLFCDMSGSTAMGERVDAESVRDMVFRYFHTMRAAIERHDGTVEKFIGDAVVAVFGVPVAHEDDALRAVRAAWEMQQRLAELNEELERSVGTTIALRIGLNSGEVVAGDSSSRQTIVTGDAVNVAARLEQAASPGEILLGEPTYRLVRAAVSVEPVEPIAAKGKSEPVGAYRLVAVLPDGRPERPRATELVGRQAELAELRAVFEAAVRDRACRLATVVGEPGVGKSRLAAELVASVSQRAQVHSGRCLSYGEGITFWPIAEIVRQAAHIRDEHSPGDARERIRSLVTGAHAKLVAERVAQAIGLSEGSAAAEEIAWSIRTLVADLAKRRPLLLLVDDIHWGEPALLDLLGGLPRLIEQAPIVLLCLARPELLDEHPDWPGVIALGPFGEHETASLLERLLPADVPADLRARVLHTAGGNPLFAEELAALISEEGAESEIPPSLRALLGARLDRLPDAERTALECAAIEGELFHRGAASWLAERDLSPELGVLAGKQFIRAAQAQFADYAAFRFRHILVREAAYSATAKRQRATLHARFANWLEQAAGERVAEVEEILGHHLERAYRLRAELGPVGDEGSRLAARAAERLARAGARALDRGDVGAATKMLARATELFREDDPARLEPLLQLGTALGKVADFARAEAVLIEASECARAAGELRVALLAGIEREYVRSFAGSGSPEQLLTTAQQAAAEFERTNDDSGQARALGRACVALVQFLRLEEAENAGESALLHARRAGARADELEILEWLMCALMWGPRPADTVGSRLERFLRDYAGSLPVQWIALIGLAQVAGMQGDLERARASFAASKRITAKLGLTVNLAGTSMQVAEVELWAGDPAAAERDLRSGIALLEKIGADDMTSSLATLLAVSICAQGRYDEAEAIIVASEQAQPSRDLENQILIGQTRARILASRREFAESQRIARKMVEQGENIDRLSVHAESFMTLADVLRLAGRPNESGAAAQSALGLFERKGNVVCATRARRLLADLTPAPAP